MNCFRELHVDGSRPRQIDLDDARYAAGPRRHGDDAVGEQNGLADVVRHEDHGLLVRVPDAHQLEAELLARHGVERRERLVHQQNRRIVNERAADRNPLLHAAGELARKALLEAAQDRRD